MRDIEQVVSEIEDIVNKETLAWNTQNVELLISIFHPDMVWPWPKHPMAHNPMDWVMEWGRYDYDRWKKGWQDLFDTHKLIRNERVIKKIEVSQEGDGAFAVVDIDTLWRDAEGKDNHWKGRTCKVYTLIDNEWKMMMQTGVLVYDDVMI
ncbi:MAG: YybH family protein [Candidatus Thorarchaeota archaeon]